MENLQFFQTFSFIKALKMFFVNLQVPVNYIVDKPASPQDVLGEQFNATKEGLELMDDVYVLGMVDDAAFTNTESIITTQEDVKGIKNDYEGLLIFGVTLKIRKDGLLPTRSQLAEVTRAFNRSFPHTPVTVVFRYFNYISVANAERQAYKRESREGEKIGKVSILKDVRTFSTHRGHIDILEELTIPKSGNKAVTTFSQLYNHWRKILSTQTLNKRFYQELFHWYLWAKKHIEIPAPPKSEKQDKETLTSIFTIRLLTRLLFVWFVKEKKLIPNKAFDEDYISEVLKKFDPDGTTNALGKRYLGSYYNAILQNLFFATLNTPMDKDPAGKDERRQFIDESKGKGGYNDQHLDPTKYRHSELLKDPKVLIMLFKDVPFLNGGLFECLDYKEADGTDKRYDGFSVTKSKQPSVPDVLFFSPASEEDLSSDFDNDSKMRRVRIRGLIKIFDSYKFTIAENTPLEEEIALDPELLGKVFENLLASYNPETKTTARKQTGSFYTPREIVNYMVDESLKAYLMQKLINIPEAYVEAGKAQPDMFGNNYRKGQLKIETPIVASDEKKQKKLQDALERLFDDAQPENDFSDDECRLMIKSISYCRILDPACGSGAFPMGILHRMVNLLARLDPHNKAWKEAQLNKAQADLKSAKAMEDTPIREITVAQAEQRIEYIKDSFANQKHELDYTRKLFLIENCIYGVDIQQIAVQIAKLRFFISLMSAQQVDDNRPNRNILSMPNLETKFVAANTLIALEKNVSSKKGTLGAMELRSEAVKKLELELKDFRKQIFFTRSYKQKKKLKLQEKSIRDKLKDELIKSSWGEKSAAQAVEWDAFDQMHHAPFFDSETMFGFIEGFDVIIGNPPYVQLQKLDENLKMELKRQQYETFDTMGDIYSLFFESGTKFLRKKGLLTFITSNKWMKANYGEKTRKFFIEKVKPILLVDFGSIPIFETVTVDTSILVFRKDVSEHPSMVACQVSNDVFDEHSLNSYVSNNYIIVDQLSSKPWIFGSNISYQIKQKISLIGKPLALHGIKVNYGIKTGLNEAFIIDEVTRNHLIKQSKISSEILKPILLGRDIKRYSYSWNRLWLINSHNGIKAKDINRVDIKKYPAVYKYLENFKKELENRSDKGDHWTNLRNCAYLEDFSKPKIVWGNLALNSQFAFVDQEMFVNAPSPFFKTDDLYLLALLNSRIGSWYIKSFGVSRSGGYVEFKPMFVEQFPIPVINPSLKKPFVTLVQEILALKSTDPFASTDKLERQIDNRVYRLYKLSFEEASMIEGDTEWMSKTEYEDFVNEEEKELWNV